MPDPTPPHVSPDSTRLRVDVRSTGWVTAAVLVAIGVLALFRIAGPALLQIATGVVLALALDPLVVAVGRRLDRPRSQAVGVVAVGFVTVSLLVIVFVGPPAARQASRFGKELPATLRQFEELPLVGPALRRYDLEDTGKRWLAELPNRFDAAAMQQATARVLSNVVSFVVVGAVTIGALLDGPRLLGLIRSLFRRRPERLERVDQVGRVLFMTLGQYFGGSLTVAAMMGLFVMIVGLALSVPLAPLAALWAAFTDLIPQVGGLLGGGFLVMLALTKGPVTALVAGGLFLVYMNLENHVISPAIVGQSVGLTPATTMIAAFVGGAIAGLPGSLVATPLVGAAKRLYLQFVRGEPVETPPHRSPRERLAALWAKVRRVR